MGLLRARHQLRRAKSPVGAGNGTRWCLNYMLLDLLMDFLLPFSLHLGYFAGLLGFLRSSVVFLHKVREHLFESYDLSLKSL